MTSRTHGPAPAVSVVIPVYNAASDVATALTSVFAQSFTDYEVILVNDGSTDRVELLRAIVPFRDRLVLIEQENRGAAAARNVAIRAARGKYVALLDADDLWRPEFLRRQVWQLDAERACDLVYTDALISGESDLAGTRFMAGAPSTGEVTLISLIEQRCNIILSTVVARRRALIRAGLFDESLRRGHDFDLWLRMALAGARIDYRREVLAERRARRDGLSGDAVAVLERPLTVLSAFARRADLPADVRLALRLRMMKIVDLLEIERGKRLLREGKFVAAREHLAATRQPPLKVRLALLGLRMAPELVQRAYRILRPPVVANVQ